MHVTISPISPDAFWAELPGFQIGDGDTDIPVEHPNAHNTKRLGYSIHTERDVDVGSSVHYDWLDSIENDVRAGRISDSDLKTQLRQRGGWVVDKSHLRSKSGLDLKTPEGLKLKVARLVKKPEGFEAQLATPMSVLVRLGDKIGSLKFAGVESSLRGITFYRRDDGHQIVGEIFEPIEVMFLGQSILLQAGNAVRLARTDNDSPFEIEYADTKRNGGTKATLDGREIAIKILSFQEDATHLELIDGTTLKLEREFSAAAIAARNERGCRIAKSVADIPDIIQRLELLEVRVQAGSFDAQQVVDDFISLETDQRAIFFDGAKFRRKMGQRFEKLSIKLQMALADKGTKFFYEENWLAGYQYLVTLARLMFYVAEKTHNIEAFQAIFCDWLNWAAMALFNHRMFSEGMFALGSDADLESLVGKNVMDVRAPDVLYKISGVGDGVVRLTVMTAGDANAGIKTTEAPITFLRLWEEKLRTEALAAIRREILDGFVSKNGNGEYLFDGNVMQLANVDSKNAAES